MRDFVVTAIVLGLLPMVFLKPYIGVYLWSWIGYMNPHRLSWGFAYNFPFALIIAASTIMGLVFSKQKKNFNWAPVIYIIIVFNLWFLVTSFLAIYPDGAFDTWKKVIKIQMMVFITLMVITERKHLNMMIMVIAFSLGFYGVKGGIFTILTGGQHMVIGPPSSFIEGNTEIALALVMTLPLIRYVQTIVENKWIRHALTFAMLFTGVAIVGSYSRGAFLAGFAMAFFLWWKSPKKAVLGILMVVAIPLVIAFMPEKYMAKMGTIETYEEDASAMGRINAWWFAFNLANDHPITGGGFGAFDKALFRIYAPEPDDFHDAHSIYFEVLGEHGYVGLVLFFTIGIMAWRMGSRIVKKTRKRPDLKWAEQLASMVQVSIIGFAVGGAFLGLAYFDLYYHLIAILVITNYLVDKSLKEEQSHEAVATSDSISYERRPIQEKNIFR